MIIASDQEPNKTFLSPNFLLMMITIFKLWMEVGKPKVGGLIPNFLLLLFTVPNACYSLTILALLRLENIKTRFMSKGYSGLRLAIRKS